MGVSNSSFFKYGMLLPNIVWCTPTHTRQKDSSLQSNKIPPDFYALWDKHKNVHSVLVLFLEAQLLYD